MEPAPERQCDSWRRSCTASARGGPVSDSFGRRADDLPARRRRDVRLRRRGDVTVSETHVKQRDRGTTTRTGVTRPFPRLTFGAAVREVLDDYRINRRRSLVDVERHVRLHLGPFFGRRRMAAITTTDVRRYVARRQDEGAKNATINRELSVLQRAFTLAIAAGTLPSRPHIALLREDNVRRGFFERDEFESVRRRLPPDLADLVSFLYTTGPLWRAPRCGPSAGSLGRCSPAITSSTRATSSMPRGSSTRSARGRSFPPATRGPLATERPAGSARRAVSRRACPHPITVVISAMAIAQSKLTAQGQISVPAEVRRKLGVGPGSVLEWAEEGEKIVVRRAARYTSEEVHRALFPHRRPQPRTLEEMKEGVRRHVRGRRASR